MKKCHRCGTPWEAESLQPKFREYCAHCSAWLHACLNCRFYERGRPNHCQIPNTEAVRDRAAANFCEEFEFRLAASTTVPPPAQEAARARLQAAFGTKPPTPSAADLLGAGDSTPREFDDLFKA